MRCYGEVRHYGRGSFPASRDHECWCDPTVAAFCESKIAKVAPAFYKIVQDDDVEAWFKMQVWMLQYLSRDFKESDGVIIDAHDSEVFKTRLLDEDWEPDFNHVAFAQFATAGFHIIFKRYLEQTSSHLIGKLKSFVEVDLQDSSSAPHPLSDSDDGSLVGR
jgi:hypothetical protein